SPGHARVFGGVDRPAGFGDDAVQSSQHAEQVRSSIREIQRQGSAGPWERKHTSSRGVAELFENRQEGASPAARDFGQQRGGSIACGGGREYALMLQETIRAVHPVPVIYPVQWIEIALVVRNMAFAAPGLPPVV